MSELQRRDFLRAAITGLALPAWMASSFAAERRGGWWQAGDDETDEVALLRTAYSVARRTGKPLLVLVIPTDPRARRASGQAWGQLLNHGSVEVLADLALCEVVCAETTVLREALGNRISLPATLPSALLVEPDRLTFEPLTIRLEGEPPLTFDGQWEKLHEAFVRERIAQMEQDLRAKIAGSRTLLERRVRACCAALELDPNTALSEGVDTLEGNVEQKLRRAPAIVRWHAERIAPERAPWLAALAGASNARLRHAAPQGASWATSTGCGIQIEGEDRNRAVACGMGHVPEISARFLHFMTR